MSVPTYFLTDRPNEVYSDFFDEQLAHAQALGTKYHNLGYVHLVVNPLQWAELPGNITQDAHGNDVVRPIPTAFVKPPPLPLNSTANQRAIHTTDNQAYADEQAITLDIKAFALKAIGPDNIDIIKEDRVGVRNLGPNQIMESMRDLYSAVDSSTIIAWTKAMEQPHSSSNKLVKTMSTQRQLHVKLADANQPLSEFAKINNFAASIASFSGALELLKDYKKLNPRVEDQNFFDLMTHVIVHEPLMTTGSMGFSANAVMTEERVKSMISESRAEAYAQGLAAGMRGSGTGRFGGRGGSRGGSRGGRGGQGVPTGRGRASGPVRRYCHLHGYDGHTSPRCYQMGADPATFTAAMRAATSHMSPVGGCVDYF